MVEVKFMKGLFILIIALVVVILGYAWFMSDPFVLPPKVQKNLSPLCLVEAFSDVNVVSYVQCDLNGQKIYYTNLNQLVVDRGRPYYDESAKFLFSCGGFIAPGSEDSRCNLVDCSENEISCLEKKK